jgi:hypothetical protein
LPFTQISLTAEEENAEDEVSRASTSHADRTEKDCTVPETERK